MTTPSPASRAIARVIDLGIILVPTALVGALAGGVGQGLVVAALLAAYLYETLMVSITGTTIGKQRMGLRVVDVDTGAKPATVKGRHPLLVGDRHRRADPHRDPGRPCRGGVHLGFGGGRRRRSGSSRPGREHPDRGSLTL